jgi:hypothetical protein
MSYAVAIAKDGQVFVAIRGVSYGLDVTISPDGKIVYDTSTTENTLGDRCGGYERGRAHPGRTVQDVSTAPKFAQAFVDSTLPLATLLR